MNEGEKKYAIEIWHKGVERLGEISQYCKNIRYKLVRNGVEELDFDIDLKQFEAFCKRIGAEPRNILEPLITDIKVKRNGEYLFGAVVVDDPGELQKNSQFIHVSCDGYLNLLANRYVTPSPFIHTESTEIAWALIEATQNQPRGDLGITRGQMYQTGVYRDRTDYADQNVKEGITNLTNLETGSFDISFSHDRTFNTYEMLGNPRPEIKIVYPAEPNEGIGAVSVVPQRTGSTLFNRIIAKGYGMGEQTLRHVEDDVVSQINYGIHEKVLIYNDISEKDTLIAHARGALNEMKGMLDLPKIKVTGASFDLNDIKLGDRITVLQSAFKMYEMNGLYRIEQIDVTLDDQMAEDIDLTFDNYGIGQG